MEPLAPVKTNRALHVFKIPAKLSKESGIKSIGMVELLPSEEEMAAQACGQEIYKISQRLACAALREVDGVQCNVGDGTAEEMFARVGPKIRALIQAGYSKLHSPAEGDGEDFLASHTVVAK